IVGILNESERASNARVALLEEQGREALLANLPGIALAYLVEAARSDHHDGALDFMIADAIRGFDAQIKELGVASGRAARMAVSPDGKHVAIAATKLELWRLDGTEPPLELPVTSAVRRIA